MGQSVERGACGIDGVVKVTGVGVGPAEARPRAAGNAPPPDLGPFDALDAAAIPVLNQAAPVR